MSTINDPVDQPATGSSKLKAAGAALSGLAVFGGVAVDAVAKARRVRRNNDRNDNQRNDDHRDRDRDRDRDNDRGNDKDRGRDHDNNHGKDQNNGGNGKQGNGDHDKGHQNNHGAQQDNGPRHDGPGADVGQHAHHAAASASDAAGGDNLVFGSGAVGAASVPDGAVGRLDSVHARRDLMFVS